MEWGCKEKYRLLNSIYLALHLLNHEIFIKKKSSKGIGMPEQPTLILSQVVNMG